MGDIEKIKREDEDLEDDWEIFGEGGGRWWI